MESAYAEQQVAEDEGHEVVLPGGAKGELPVPPVVGDEADLAEDEGEVDGIQQQEPSVVEDHQPGQAHHQQAERGGELARVVDGLWVHQPVLLDAALQLSVSADQRAGSHLIHPRPIALGSSVCLHMV